MRVHFAKTGLACFISHIDLPMLFGRAARRAGLKPEQTQGFSPHPRLALGPPLPVGVVGLREPAEFWFDRWDEGALDAWRFVMPRGIALLEAYAVGGVSLNKLCTAASYEVRLPEGSDPATASAHLNAVLGERGALLRMEIADDTIRLSSTDLERCGPSFMVRTLADADPNLGWRSLGFVRTAVGLWSEAEGNVTPLTEEFIK